MYEISRNEYESAISKVSRAIASTLNDGQKIKGIRFSSWYGKILHSELFGRILPQQYPTTFEAYGNKLWGIPFSIDEQMSKDKMFEIHLDIEEDEKTERKIAVQEFTGWLGGTYEDFGLFDTQEDAARGICGDKQLHELLKEFDGKQVKITIEEV